MKVLFVFFLIYSMFSCSTSKNTIVSTTTEKTQKSEQVIAKDKKIQNLKENSIQPGNMATDVELKMKNKFDTIKPTYPTE
jgi:uncharacterized Rossmann fold enzyme